MGNHENRKGFSRKHGPDGVVEAPLKAAVSEAARDGRLPCAVAFSVAESLGRNPTEVGKAADLAELRLVKCQLGLFGYDPDGKIVSAREPSPELRRAIDEAAEDGRIACAAVWRIAARMDVGKLSVSGACEAMGLRIKPCQLGAF